MPVEVWIGLGVVLAILLAFMMIYGRRSVDRTPEDVAQIIRNFINGKGGEWDWDDFESFTIADPDLERIRQEALTAAPPNPDLVKLADLANQAEALAKAK